MYAHNSVTEVGRLSKGSGYPYMNMSSANLRPWENTRIPIGDSKNVCRLRCWNEIHGNMIVDLTVSQFDRWPDS
jgi:hypothetical protein